MINHNSTSELWSRSLTVYKSSLFVSNVMCSCLLPKCVCDVARILKKNSTSSVFGTNKYLCTHTQAFLEIRYSIEERSGVMGK